ncbi:hypothetical protein PRK78_000882 [Emydomyces testavorans]|uniref:Uncharacterized protein n=1 Tax=Emydomyces testavorans TaxID=2070801 RepID=A0AAF0IGA6_9EURO|nr:hypothetical protein PRK78_000882 [Emydomyces testavorans]
MQFKVSLALVAALAAFAEANPHRRFFRRNVESSARVSYVTVQPVPLYPTGAASSSDIISIRPPTMSAATAGTGVATSYPVPTGPVSTETLTLTYTLGRGVSKTVVTKTITRPSVGKPTDIPNNGNAPGGNQAGGEVTSSKTTVSATSTTTKTITLYPTHESFNPGEGNNKVPCVPATETITLRETVTVTATPEAQSTGENHPGHHSNKHPRPPVTTIPTPPYNNGTAATSTVYPSSGFLTKPHVLPTGY